MSDEIILYDYPKSSASYRVRIMLNLIGVTYKIVTVNLLDGAQSSPQHLARNPQGFVPALQIDGQMLTQSLSIISYLEQTRGYTVLPEDPVAQAKCRAAAMAIAIDLHPICNLSVMRYATGGEEPERTTWMHHFIKPGLMAFEALIAAADFKKGKGEFCGGAELSLADICLIPQLYNAKRWGVDYKDCPHIRRAEAACQSLPAFIKAHPDTMNEGI